MANPKLLGQTSANVESERYIFDPLNGIQKVTSLNGALPQLYSIARSAWLRGARAEVRSGEGGQHFCEIHWGDVAEETAEQDQEIWERVFEIRELPIVFSPILIKSAGGGEAGRKLVSQWYKEIENAISLNPQPEVVLDYDGKIKLYNFMQKGGRSFVSRYYVLRRRRTVPFRMIARRSVDAVEKAYVTTALIRDFAVPPDIASILPDIDSSDTSLTDGEGWAWVERQNSSTITPNVGRAEEVIEWIYGVVSPIAYEIVE